MLIDPDQDPEEQDRLQQMAWARGVRDEHDPAQQDHGYERCEHCNYVRHPCDSYELADLLIKALEKLDQMEGGVQ